MALCEHRGVRAVAACGWRPALQEAGQSPGFAHTLAGACVGFRAPAHCSAVEMGERELTHSRAHPHRSAQVTYSGQCGSVPVP